MYTHTISHRSTSAKMAASGMATSHMADTSMMAAARLSPPPRRTPTVLVESKERSGMRAPVKVRIRVAMEADTGVRWKSG